VLLDLPANVRRVLGEFVEGLLRAAGPQVESVILFGSAAEGRMRPTSDVNLLVISQGLGMSQLDEIRPLLRSGRAAVGLKVMFLESAEVANAFEAFAVKFSDIKARHRVLFGQSPLEKVEITRAAAVRRLRQVLLNLTLRLRERYAAEGDHEEVLARILADVTGPLRASAATLMALRDGRQRAPKPALEEFCADGSWEECLAGMSAVHRGERLAPGQMRALLSDVLRLLATLDEAAYALT
jgi:predicted nucleotidyltransferase